MNRVPTNPNCEPALDEVRRLAADHDLVPIRHTMIDDCETPVSAFLKLRAASGIGASFLLESAAQGQQVGRYSFIGVRPREVVRWSLGDDGDPYELAREAAAATQAPFDGAPPFTGGAVGFFAYDLVRTVETTLGDPNPDVLGLPDLALMVSDVLVVFDHLRHTVTILANAHAENVDSSYADACVTIAEIRAILDGPLPRPQAGRRHRPEPEFSSNMSREQFEAMVSRIIEYVHAGDAFQVVPSQRWSAELGDLDAFSVYRGLRAVNPSPYMYFLDFEDFEIVGASPEPLLTVTGRHASMRPIAGTRPRGADPQEMLEDEKERAEHIMLVDLARNDLGRVCEYDTVGVDELMVVEQYSTVMHLVSSVSGELREGMHPLDALRAILPAGTLSGAPKVRAMEIIDELEPVKRGGYGGAVGYIGYSGDLDTCIHIRTVVIKDGVAHIQAGGGTVADAKPDYEFVESENKARAVKAAIALASQQEGWF
ncbi:MAG: chorismate-binding protein [Baekduia sp.]